MLGFDPSLAESATLVAALLAAVAADLRSHRIPNALSVVVLLAGLGWQYVTAGGAGIAAGIGGAAVGLACFLPFYVRRAMGAGDVKWMAAVGTFFGIKGALLAVACALIAGGLVAVGYLAWRALRGAAGAVREGDVALAVGAAWVQASLARHERLPFALPIAIGAFAALWVAPHTGARAIGFWGGP